MTRHRDSPFSSWQSTFLRSPFDSAENRTSRRDTAPPLTLHGLYLRDGVTEKVTGVVETVAETSEINAVAAGVAAGATAGVSTDIGVGRSIDLVAVVTAEVGRGAKRGFPCVALTCLFK